MENLIKEFRDLFSVPCGVRQMMAKYGFIGRSAIMREIRHRRKLAKTCNKNKFSAKNDVFADIYEKKLWGSSESRSGMGSHVAATGMVREFLAETFKKYKIQSMLDIPCGDFNWMRLVDMTGVQYTGGDIVPKIIEKNNQLYGEGYNLEFRVLDVTRDDLPRVDLVFCKDCLQHLSESNARAALRNFKKNGAKYLLVTSYPLSLINWDILDGDYRPLNLQAGPFLLPVPLDYVQEKPDGPGVEPDKFMLLYETRNIPEWI
jgi:hypothetical protein